MGFFKKIKRAVKKVFKPVKKAAQKLVPKEAAGIMQMAAPFLGPIAGPITYGLGSLKQRGKISPLGMLMTMAPHLRFQGQTGTGLGGKWKFGGYGGETGIGSRSLRDMLLTGYRGDPTQAFTGDYDFDEYFDWLDTQGLEGSQEAFDLFKGTQEAGYWTGQRIMETVPGKVTEPLLGDYGTKLDKLLYGTKGGIKEFDVGKPGMPTSTIFQPDKRGWLGTAGEYDILGSKLAGAAIGTGGDPTQINTLKAVAWGSALVAGIQAGKYKDAMEAANAAEDAARGEGIVDEEWIINARSEAEAYWNAWRSEVTYEPYTGAEGGRVGYQLGVGPVGGIGAMAPQLPMQQPMQQPMMQQPMQQQMQNPPPTEGGLGRLPIEADMRYTGGFMPYGETEKADDVPARLSKNEFVFTADAVKAAGGGSVNKGAKKLYDTMKQLEAMA